MPFEVRDKTTQLSVIQGRTGQRFHASGSGAWGFVSGGEPPGRVHNTVLTFPATPDSGYRLPLVPGFFQPSPFRSGVSL